MDSKQPSISCITNFGASTDNRSIICESRRQSTNAPNLESMNMSGNLQTNESSPFIAKKKKLDTTPLYIINDSATDGNSIPENFGSSNGIEDLEQNTKRPLAKVRPRQILKIDASPGENEVSTNSSFQECHFASKNFKKYKYPTLRESLSLDLFPNCKSFVDIDLFKMPVDQFRKRKSHHASGDLTQFFNNGNNFIINCSHLF